MYLVVQCNTLIDNEMAADARAVRPYNRGAIVGVIMKKGLHACAYNPFW